MAGAEREVWPASAEAAVEPERRGEAVGVCGPAPVRWLVDWAAGAPRWSPGLRLVAAAAEPPGRRGKAGAPAAWRKGARLLRVEPALLAVVGAGRSVFPAGGWSAPKPALKPAEGAAAGRPRRAWVRAAAVAAWVAEGRIRWVPGASPPGTAEVAGAPTPAESATEWVLRARLVAVAEGAEEVGSCRRCVPSGRTETGDPLRGRGRGGAGGTVQRARRSSLRGSPRMARRRSRCRYNTRKPR